MLNGLDRSQLAQVLKSLVPRDQNELSVLRTLIASVQEYQRKTLAEMAMSGFGDLMAMAQTEREVRNKNGGTEFREFVASLPQDTLRYFHGLAEALEIYQSIHHQPVPVGRLTVDDASVHELRQIRDMCLDEGLRSIY